MNLKNSRSDGFTIVEILLVSVLIVFVGFAVQRALLSGLSVYRWIEKDNSNKDIVMFFSRFSDEFKNICFFPEHGFNGGVSKVEFYIHNTGYLVLPGESVKQNGPPIRRIRYEYNEEEGAVYRNEYPYGGYGPIRRTLALDNVESFSLRYSEGSVQGTDGPLFVPEIKTIPGSVKVQVEHKKDRGGGLSLVVDVPIVSRRNI